MSDRSDLSVRCTVEHTDGTTEVLPDGRTRDLIFSIPTLVARLSALLELPPGDVIFTGTPAGIGHGRTPKMYLQPGDVLTTEIEAVGTLVQRFISSCLLLNANAIYGDTQLFSSSAMKSSRLHPPCGMQPVRPKRAAM